VTLPMGRLLVQCEGHTGLVGRVDEGHSGGDGVVDELDHVGLSGGATIKL
jgi:hypothetical protein